METGDEENNKNTEINKEIPMQLSEENNIFASENSQISHKNKNESTQRNENKVVTIDFSFRNEGETEDDYNWMDILNSYREKEILNGKISGIEHINNCLNAIVYYKNKRIIIPIQEMGLLMNEDGIGESEERENRSLSLMLGAEIDFEISVVDNNE